MGVNKTNRANGQALAETALVMVILLLLLSGIVDLGRAMFTWLALQNAAAEGAYYASAFPGTSEYVGTVGTTNPDTVIYRVQHESNTDLLDWTKPGVDVDVSWSPTPPVGDAPRPGGMVLVRIQYPFEFIGPLPNLLGFDNIEIAATARQVILTDRVAE